MTHRSEQDPAGIEHNTESTPPNKEGTFSLPENWFYIPTEIKADNLRDIVTGLRKVEQGDSAAEVLVEVNTTGGDIGAATELALVMHHSPLSISTLVTNKAYSAGIAIAAAGDKGQRFAYPESDFLIHPTTYTVDGKFTLQELKESYNRKARAEKRYISLLATLTGNSMESMEEQFEGERYMNAEEALRLGIIDHIL